MQTSNGQTKSAELVNQLIIYDGRERWGWYFGLSFDQPNQLPPQEVYSAELAQVGTKKSALVLQMENKRMRTVQKVIWQIIWKLHNAQWLKTKSVNSRPWLEMLHFFNALYSDSVQEWIRLLQSNREELNSDRQSFRGDGAYETETWTLCKATNLKHGLYKTQP